MQQNYPVRTIVIELDFPFTAANGEVISSVTMRSPTVRDRLVRARDNTPQQEADTRMIATLCGLGYDDILNMEGADYLRLEEQFMVFLTPPAKESKTTL